MHLNRNDIDNLRLAADKAKTEGRFEAGQKLYKLLDALEAADENETIVGESVKRIETLESALGTIRKTVGRMKLDKRADPDDMDEAALRREVCELREAIVDIDGDAEEAL